MTDYICSGIWRPGQGTFQEPDKPVTLLKDPSGPSKTLSNSTPICKAKVSQRCHKAQPEGRRENWKSFGWCLWLEHVEDMGPKRLSCLDDDMNRLGTTRPFTETRIPLSLTG